MSDYRNKLLLSYLALAKAQGALTDRIINVGMLGEFAEVNQTFVEGDTFRFDLEMFRHSKDQNLLLLLELFHKLDETMNSLANINGITEEELEDLEDDLEY
ncbi:hypothetical protein [Salinimicrobium sp. HB62]|uniref:hypothetical protein n=1 Tax=Salinimicrobium sp. HB62 TaxID=3077781 RepID=UPI002D79CE1E|nr:hypothetical protein [Salinimicrobium sp. HB62]